MPLSSIRPTVELESLVLLPPLLYVLGCCKGQFSFRFRSTVRCRSLVSQLGRGVISPSVCSVRGACPTLFGARLGIEVGQLDRAKVGFDKHVSRLQACAQHIKPFLSWVNMPHCAELLLSFLRSPPGSRTQHTQAHQIPVSRLRTSYQCRKCLLDFRNTYVSDSIVIPLLLPSPCPS